MLRKLHDMTSYTVDAIDGIIGTVSDFEFDDSDWSIRFIVIDADGLESGRKVLLTPAVVGQVDFSNQRIPVSLTKGKVRNSPELIDGQPITRLYERSLRDYYGWPAYWKPDLSDVSGQATDENISRNNRDHISKTSDEATFDIPGQEEEPTIPDSTLVSLPEDNDDDEVIDLEFAQSGTKDLIKHHLRSALDLRGYHICSNAGEAGSVDDLIFDDTDWVIRYFAINTRGSHHGKIVLLGLNWINSVSWSASNIEIVMNREDLEKTPDFDPTIPVTREYEKMLYDYYETLKP